MGKLLNKIIDFKGDKLFNGAVNIDWFHKDHSRAVLASESFVFHGPEYHAVSQRDIGENHSHRLVDTASFARTIARRCYGLEEQSFTLAIAGYGTGKSHLGLTLAELFNSPGSACSKEVMKDLQSADAEIANDVLSIIETANQPCLVVALNGIKGFDLSAEVTQQVVSTLKRDGHETTHLDNLRPRFKQATSLVGLSNDNVRRELLEYTAIETIDQLLAKLSNQDELVYSSVYKFFDNRGMPIRVLAGESIRDVLDITVKEYCGRGKPYRSILILFDEFGKYTEFATIRSQIAGSGVLQEMFEGIQGNEKAICFVGFIQFELSAYVQRIAPEYKNEILRYISRYQIADKLYLSINLETLIAHLIEKKDSKFVEELFDDNYALRRSEKIMHLINRWFPQSTHFRTWSELDTFHSVICKGCWPLAPISTWLLFHLATAGKHLQERSALALLGDVINRELSKNKEMLEGEDWVISPVEFCSELLLEELISSEVAGQQGSIAHSYKTVLSKHGTRFSVSEKGILTSILLASKLGLVVEDHEDAIVALATLSSTPNANARQNIDRLHHEYNVIEWDESFKAFDILGDAVPRTQFLAFLRQKIDSTYDETAKSMLFASKALELCDLLQSIDCDFAEDNKISTREWHYSACATNLDYLPQQVKIACDRWDSGYSIDESKGTVIYCYVEQGRSFVDAENKVKTTLSDAAQQCRVKLLPIIIVILHDVDGKLGQVLAQLSVIDDLEEIEKERYKNLIESQKEKLARSIQEEVATMLRQRFHITSLPSLEGKRRLSQIGKSLFSAIYDRPISFPFDGFSTTRGNASSTCHQLTLELMHGKLDYDTVAAKPVKEKNRAIAVLRDDWKVFNANGAVSRRPKHDVLSSLTVILDEELKKNNMLSIEWTVKYLCSPPYGANLASAGLFLGVYMSARSKNILVMRDNETITVNEWLQGSIFRGKYLNLPSLQADYLLLLGASSSEWEVFLDEWEAVDSYESRVNFLNRSADLKKKMPVPPALVYREERFSALASDAAKQIARMENRINTAWDQLEIAMKKKDSGIASNVAKEFKEILDFMGDQPHFWSDSRMSEVEKYYSESRQHVKQYFKSWLNWQTPRSDTPEVVGDFKYKMKRIEANLLKIGFEEESHEIAAHTRKSVRNAELLTNAKQLARDASSWLTEHSDSLGSCDLLSNRIVIATGEKLLTQLKEMAKKVECSGVEQRGSEVERFLDDMVEKEKQYEIKLNDIWGVSIDTHNDIIEVSKELKELLEAYHGIQEKEKELLYMRQAVVLFKDCLERVSDENLTWSQFSELEETLKKSSIESIDQEKIPWEVDQVLASLFSAQAELRERKSLEWYSNLADSMKDLQSMSATEANQIHNRISSIPAYVTTEHAKELESIDANLIEHLNNLSIEWLIEKFKELPKGKQKVLLDRLASLHVE